MSEVGAAAAQRHREHMRDKAERLGGGEDARSVDSSSFTPGEPLNADAKTGMRPVSRQARRNGGPVGGEMSPLGPHALARPGRTPRARGGALGGESYVNRNAKEANEDREGRKHDMGLKAGGRAARADGGGINRDSGVFKPDIEREDASHTRSLRKRSASAAVETRLGRAAGGRTGRADGGPLAAPISNAGRLGSFNYEPNRATLLADGGRAKAHERYGASPGPAEHHPGMEGRAGRAYGGAAPGSAENVGTSDAGPLGAPGPGEHKGAVGQESFRHRSPRGENSSRARTLAAAKARAYGGSAAERDENLAAEHAEDPKAYRAKYKGPFGTAPSRLSKEQRDAALARVPKPFREGGKVAEGALKQHRAEHKAMGAHPKGCTCAKCSGGKVERARGGKAGKGKTNINIVIGTPGGMSQGPVPPGANPQLAIKPPAPAAPMPMPAPPGGAPPGMPMPMPIPMPAAGPAGPPGPPGMPPRARGGRAPKVRGEPEAGSGSGLGRLQKAEEYGARSREGAGMRK